ncbi:MAG TPA: triose-phosphate isomerase [Patescibacteria group bacterium]|nr:triose-phosphate isomerase [Patescibacteria group bacterium]
MTRLLIGTSWKMNLTPSEATAWFGVARPLLEPLTARRDLFVLPPAPAIQAARDALAGSAIGYGGQDVHPDDCGAHTGDIAAPMLSDLGSRYAEIGHSERRRDHGETDALVAAKVQAVLRWRLTPIVCIGETTQGPANAAVRIVEGQLDGAFGALLPEALDDIVVAYEPVWAIGEGAAAAETSHVAAVHGSIGRWLTDRGATVRRVLYGGSVDESNAAELLATPGVGGLFVGRAALDPRRFAAIAATPGPDDDTLSDDTLPPDTHPVSLPARVAAERSA